MSSFNEILIEMSKGSRRTITLLFLSTIAILHIFTFIYMPIKYGKNEIINGYYDDKFKNVYNMFK